MPFSYVALIINNTRTLTGLQITDDIYSSFPALLVQPRIRHGQLESQLPVPVRRGAFGRCKHGLGKWLDPLYKTHSTFVIGPLKTTFGLLAIIGG